MAQEVIMKEAREKMDKSVEAFGREMGNIRTGRATPGRGVSIQF